MWDILGMILGYLFWFILLFGVMSPYMSARSLKSARYRLIALIERKYGHRVVTLIHREEKVGLFGIPIHRYIDIEDSEAVIRAIRSTPPEAPLMLIIHTPGGLVLAAEQVACALKRHPAKVTVFVPHYAMSGGTLIALAADEIVMDDNAVLGPVDPQLGQQPAASILKVVERKPIAEIDDNTLILADVAEKAIRQVKATVTSLLEDKMGAEQAAKVAETLATGVWTHDYPITVAEARELGLPVSTEMPEEIYRIMALYPQTAQRRPSVEYIPSPHPAEAPTNNSLVKR